eukprot:m.157994 g.157994  ORF g.157994 m.157994 type:complete len:55 (+) comp15124_c0_seq20:2723-2887(+)
MSIRDPQELWPSQSITLTKTLRECCERRIITISLLSFPFLKCKQILEFFDSKFM